MAEFKEEYYDFSAAGIAVQTDDRFPEGRWPVLINLRSYRNRSLMPRRGVTVKDTQTGRVNGVGRIENEIDGIDAYVGVFGTTLRTAVSVSAPSFSSADTATFSGNGVSMLTAKPWQSNVPWVYIGDTSAQRKVTYHNPQGAGNAVAYHPIGIRTPVRPPSAYLADDNGENVPRYYRPDALDDYTDWTFFDSATGAGSTRVAAGSAITVVYYDGGGTGGTGPGWCTIVTTAAPTDIGPGTVLDVSTPSTTFQVERVTKPFAATTISKIKYDPGTTLCSVVLSDNYDSISVGDFIKSADLAAVTRYHKILSVGVSNDGRKSIRFDAGVNTFSGAEAITGLRALYGHAAGNITTSSTYGVTMVQMTCTGDGTSGMYLTAGTSVDLTTFPDVEPITPDDYIHLSVFMSVPSRVKEVRMYFGTNYNAGAPSPTSVHEASHMIAIRASELAAAVADEDTIVDVKRTDVSQDNLFNASGRGGGPDTQEVDTSIIPIPTPSDPAFDPPTPTRPRTDPKGSEGINQYREIFVRVGDLIEIGDKAGYGLESINVIQFTVQHTGDTNVRVSSLVVSGGYGPDTGSHTSLLSPYYYRYRYRNSTTGARSAYSPPFRGGVRPRRQPVLVYAPSTNTTDGYGSVDADKVDVERWGGSILSWRFLGSVDNSHQSGAPTNLVFWDRIDDLQANANAPFSNDDVIAPWPIIVEKASGSCVLAGTTIQSTATAFNTSWMQGTVIKIDGYPYQIYRVISTTILETYQSVGESAYLGTNKWEVEEPILENQNIPFWFGPFLGVTFAVGDQYNPGHLYYTNTNDPDSTRNPSISGSARIKITDPSEPLINGIVWNNRAYVWSSKRWFQLLPSTGGPEPFHAVELPGNKGLISPYALAAGERLWWVSGDGVYESLGGEPRNISEDINLIFQPEGRIAGSYNSGYVVPVGTYHGATISASDYRLSYGESRLYFDYINGNSNYTLVYDRSNGDAQAGWMIDSYDEMSAGYDATLHFYDDSKSYRRLIVCGFNGTSGKFCFMGSNGVDSVTIHSPYFDLGNTRAQKLLGDFTLDCVTQAGDSLAVTLVSESGATIASGTVTTSGFNVIDCDSYARKVRLKIVGTLTGSTDEREFIRWGTSYIIKPPDTYLRDTDWNDEGYSGLKLVRGIRIHADTSGSARTIEIYKDGGSVGATVTVNHSGEKEVEYGFSSPFTSVLLKLHPTDANSWKNFKYEFVYDKYEQVAETPTPWSDMGFAGAKFVQGMLLEADTNGSAVTVRVEKDGAVQAVTPDLSINQTVNDHTVPYSWEPFITHRARVVPQSSGKAGITNVIWVWEPEPELTNHWETQDLTFGNGYGHVKEIRFSVGDFTPSTLQFSIEVTTDSATTTTYTPSGVSGAGTRQKIRFLCDPILAQLFRFELTAAGGAKFRLYQKDIEVYYKDWSGGGAYRIIKPFGAEHFRTGALI